MSFRVRDSDDACPARVEIFDGKAVNNREKLEKDMYCVYIMSNWNNKVIYIGVTNNLERRVYEHKNKVIEGFTKKFNINKLVYFEQTSDVNSAIEREKQLKSWRREKKNALINKTNPNWNDLSKDWYK